MSGSANHAILDLGEDDFITTDYKSQTPASMTQFPVPESPGIDRDTDRLVDDDGNPARSGMFSSNFWTLAFYQQFFDVDTTTVKNRLMYSMVPVPGKSFLEHHIRPRPDLYGPFWICVTLVFSIAISGNVADFLQKSVGDNPDPTWHYDFHKVSLAATAVFSYASILPAGLYGFLWWCGAGAGAASLSFIELVCLYGYSLAIYIPVSLLWLIQVSWWQWICVLAGAGLSGSVLFLPIWPAVRDQAAKSAVIVMVVVVTLHLLLACGFMLYFFHVPAVSQVNPGGKNITEVIIENVELPEAEDLIKDKAAEVKNIKLADTENPSKLLDNKNETAGGGGGKVEKVKENEEDTAGVKSKLAEESSQDDNVDTSAEKEPKVQKPINSTVEKDKSGDT